MYAAVYNVNFTVVPYILTVYSKMKHFLIKEMPQFILGGKKLCHKHCLISNICNGIKLFPRVKGIVLIIIIYIYIYIFMRGGAVG